MKKKVVYPIIAEAFNDEDGHYYVASSPNLPGMVTQGDTLNELAVQAEDAIATILEAGHYPEVQDPADWKLNDNERVMFIAVDMQQYLAEKAKTVRRNISMPKYISDLARENKINVSQVATDAIKAQLGL
ncbi:type II toxin-antitoxin system HicB family antitoxin [Lactiplantibacillus dongliensis]|uniref:Type II toxin-antitoxin system HicB family antitoxin n=1 Tax=Lactiplantibacillus dongliensis TaxID=2559919 RepID=A0ABW1RAZ0_9LACO|nr:type II toxin-antitoxin system HicB family antitoxin [Lactiplantibacillus dongliensis]